MKKFTLYVSLVLVLLGGGCKKETEAPVKENKPQLKKMISPFRDYFACYDKGSYWVYKNVENGKTDSIFIPECNVFYDSTLINPDGTCITGIPCEISEFAVGYQFATNMEDITSIATNFYENLNSDKCTSKFDFYPVSGPTLSFFVEYQPNLGFAKTSSIGNCETRIESSLVIGGQKYNDVLINTLRLKNGQDSMQHYWVKQKGIVKKVFPKGVVYELQKSQIFLR